MKFKKLLTPALAAALALSLAAPALAAQLPEGWTPADGARMGAPWYAEAVDYVQDKGYMVGTGNGFEPETEITVASVLQALHNREGRPDTDAGALWYTNAVRWAFYSGLISSFTGDSAATRGVAEHILGNYCAMRGLTLKEPLMVGNQGGDMMDDKTLTRAEFATVLMRLDRVDPLPLTLEEYLAQGGQAWFLTGKTEYTIQGMLVSEDTPYENVLEGNSGVVTDDGITVLLKGTVDELWPSKLEKVMGTYTKPDGTELTAADFVPKDTYIDLKTKAQPDTNFAMFIPAGIQVVVETAWGDVLTANRPGVEHGEGDYLVSVVKDGEPDLGDVWILNGAVFPNTYDLSRFPGTQAQLKADVAP